MSLRTKNILYTIVLLLAMFLVWKYRQGKQEIYISFEGETMGTTYHVQYFDADGRDFKLQIDSLLKIFNQSLSTYIPDAEISQFNRGNVFVFSMPYFYPVLQRSSELHKITSGAFDPSVMPLVNAWGFGPDKQPDSNEIKIDSIMDFVGFDKILFNNDSVWKKDPRSQLDFSAIAKGYGVDLVANFISAKGVDNYFVEIGGEVVAKGNNLAKGRLWEIGILDPDAEPMLDQYRVYVSLKNRALATSGNYFNYREIDGVKYSHTIDPVSGFPVQYNLLSASVFADDCMTADALATAFMASGLDKTMAILKANPKFDAILIYSNEDGTQAVYTTDGIKPFSKFAY